MKQLVTETPEGNYQWLHNMTVIKDKEVYLRGLENLEIKGDLSLVDFCKKQCEEKREFKFDDDPPAEEFGEYMDCNCIVAYFYHMSVGHAELRAKLARYEKTGLNPEGVSKVINLANELAEEADKSTCEWEEEDSGTWSCSKCEASWEFNNGGPEDNDMHYCPKCGREIIRVSCYEEDE